MDENIDPKTRTYLRKEEVYVEHVREALWQGADNVNEILPYALENDLIVVTNDLQDFGDLEPDTYAGIVMLYEDSTPAYQIAA